MARLRHLPAALLGMACLAFACWAQALDVNTASQAELEMLKGVGPQLSEALLAERRQRPFRDWPDLMARLKGIGPARAAKLSAAGLTVGELAWAPAGAASGARALRP